MAVKGFNSSLFGKLNLENLKPRKLEVPNTDFSNLTKHITSPIELAERQVEKQNEILEFLKNVTIEQAVTAEKQGKNNRWMTGLALVFAFISIMPILREWIFPTETKNIYQNISELEHKLLLETKTTSELSIRLLDLQNQVRILEKQNESILTKKTLKK